MVGHCHGLPTLWIRNRKWWSLWSDLDGSLIIICTCSIARPPQLRVLCIVQWANGKERSHIKFRCLCTAVHSGNCTTSILSHRPRPLLAIYSLGQIKPNFALTDWVQTLWIATFGAEFHFLHTWAMQSTRIIFSTFKMICIGHIRARKTTVRLHCGPTMFITDNSRERPQIAISDWIGYWISKHSTNQRDPGEDRRKKASKPQREGRKWKVETLRMEWYSVPNELIDNITLDMELWTAAVCCCGRSRSAAWTTLQPEFNKILCVRIMRVGESERKPRSSK